MRSLLLSALLFLNLAAYGQDGFVNANTLQPVHSLAEVGITNPNAFSKVDQFIRSSITAGAFPGCRVLCAKDGKIFYDRSFGYFTYGQQNPVATNTLYDVASVTKVVSTTLAIMRLYELGKISLDKTLGDYLPMTLGTDKSSLRIRDLLLHQAGLKAWIPFYKHFFDSTGLLNPDVFHGVFDAASYRIPVAKNIWMKCDYVDTIWNMVLASPLENKGKMVYSDLDYYFLAAVAERVMGRPINRYVADSFWTPMGLHDIGFNPLGWAPLTRIAPTEYDITFRGQTIQGYVHDPGAALFGGVAGHAGVFATAQDVAAIFQMLMNGGTYNGKRFLKKETVDLFSAYGSSISRRGLGFDKPNASKTDAGPTGDRCSGYTIGHQGFTGTCVWADPQSRIVFVFLSNRVYPNADNSLINKIGVRTKVQDELYEVLGVPVNTERDVVKRKQGW